MHTVPRPPLTTWKLNKLINYILLVHTYVRRDSDSPRRFRSCSDDVGRLLVNSNHRIYRIPWAFFFASFPHVVLNMENDLGPPAEDAMMTSEKRIEIGTTWPSYHSHSLQSADINANQALQQQTSPALHRAHQTDPHQHHSRAVGT